MPLDTGSAKGAFAQSIERRQEVAEQIAESALLAAPRRAGLSGAGQNILARRLEREYLG